MKRGREKKGALKEGREGTSEGRRRINRVRGEVRENSQLTYQCQGCAP